MREINFRGKCIQSGQWIFGFYFHVEDDNPTGTHQIVEHTTSHQHNLRKVVHVVDPKTVGQYTGLIDEKGVQVFEGDIVECYGEDNEVILVAEVQFQEGGFCVQIDYDLQLIPLDTFGSAYKVIGNIYEPQK